MGRALVPNRLLQYGRPADRDNQVIEFREVESRGTIDFFEGHGTDDLRIAIDVVEAKTMEDDVSDRVRDARLRLRHRGQPDG